MSKPLVSVIISNYNYGRFLEEAVFSVLSQSYKNIECIIVDDCSTDESSSVLDRIGNERQDIRIIRSDINSGQSHAINEGLAVAKGEFVLLLDADDILLPDCIALHLSVHYTSRVSVGFTCCDSLQLVDGVIAGGRNGSISKSFLNFPATEGIISASPLRRLVEEGIDLPLIEYDSLRYISWKNLTWPWSTTSCMLFRRSVLNLVCAASEFRSIRIGSDNFVAQITNFLTGSIVFDRQLVKYRIHGNNGFSKRLHLNGLTTYDRGDDHTAQTIDVFIADLDKRFETFVEIIDSHSRLILLAALLNCLSRYANNLNPCKRTLSEVIRRNKDKWTALVGNDLLKEMLEAASCENPMKFVDAWSDEVPMPCQNRLATRIDDMPDSFEKDIPDSFEKHEVSLSPSALNAVAMEVWFEKQRWSLSYKIKKWVTERIETK